jgi:outer membrane protein TolC
VISVRESNLELALRQLERAVERYKVGVGIKADVLQSENNVLVQKSALLTSVGDLQPLLDQITALVGLPVQFELAVDTYAALADLGGDVPEELWSLVECNSFQLKSLNTQLANLRLQRESLENQKKPQVDLSLNYTRSGEDEKIGGALTGYENSSYGVGVTFSQTPGERVTETSIAQNELDIANIDLQIQDTELQLKTQLRQSQRDLQERFRQIELAESNLVSPRLWT